MDLLNEMYSLITTRWDFFYELILQHIALSGIAILIILVIGLCLGIMITYQRRVASLVLGIVNVIYTIPSVALFGIFVTFTGIGNTTALIALVLYGLLPIIRTTYVGIKQIDPDTIEAAKGMGTSTWTLLYKIQLPLASPHIMAGFRNMAVMTIALTAIASFIGAGGLGVGIWRGITTNNSPLTWVSSILVALLALGADFILGLIEKQMLKKYN